MDRRPGQRARTGSRQFRGRSATVYNRGLRLPQAYSIEWGGQFENQQRATRRLLFVLPLSVLVIFGLLVATFNPFGRGS